MKKSIAASYNKIAQEYATKHGYEEHLSLPSLKRFIKCLKKGNEVLDVGCGGGQDSKFFHDQGFIVTGIDVSSKMIQLSKQYAPGCSFRVLDLMKTHSIKKYDAIWCCRVFHHIALEKQIKFVRKLSRLLKNGGYLYITSAVSETKSDYEQFDSGSDGLLKKRLTKKSFQKILLDESFNIISFKYWIGHKGMEIIAQKEHAKKQ